MALASVPKERAFAERRARDWNDLDTLVRVAEQRGPKGLSDEAVRRLPPLYRDVCGDLSRAQAARYSAPLVASWSAARWRVGIYAQTLPRGGIIRWGK